MIGFLLSPTGLWLMFFIAFLAVEAITQSLTTIWAAIAALPMIFLSLTPFPIKWQILVFLIVTILLVLFTRPFAVEKLRVGKHRFVPYGGMLICTKAVRPPLRGEGKTFYGIVWNIESEDGSEINENDICVIKNVNGNTLIVQKQETHTLVWPEKK